MNLRFALDGASEFDLVQKRTFNDEYEMKLLALKLPLSSSPLHSLSNLDRALANHFAYQYFKKYLVRIMECFRIATLVFVLFWLLMMCFSQKKKLKIKPSLQKTQLRINRDEDLAFWEAARLRGEIRVKN